MKTTGAFAKIYDLVAQIPQGKVATYGQIAQLAGVNPRVVGFAMNSNKDMQLVPCHRVVAIDGSLRGYALGLDKKRDKLEHEGVCFLEDGKIDLKTSLYTFSK